MTTPVVTIAASVGVSAVVSIAVNYFGSPRHIRDEVRALVRELLSSAIHHGRSTR